MLDRLLELHRSMALMDKRDYPEEFKTLKEKIQQAIEKAEKFDACLRNPNEVMHWSGNTINKFHLQIERGNLLQSQNKSLSEENARLKEERDNAITTLKERNEDKRKLESQLEDITALFETVKTNRNSIREQLEQKDKALDEIRQMKSHSDFTKDGFMKLISILKKYD